MSASTKLLLSAAIVGGVCGIAGAALYVMWRATRRTAGERASSVLDQLKRVADRMDQSLGTSSANA